MQSSVKIAVYGNPPVELELESAADIFPGMILAYTTTGAVQPFPTTAGIFAPKLVAVEALLEEGNTLSQWFSAGESIPVISAAAGDVLWLIAVGAGTAYTIGDPLITFTNLGILAPQTVPGGSNTIVGRAAETKTITALVDRLMVEIS